MPELIFEMDYQATLDRPQMVGRTPVANRAIAVVTGGEFSGDRLKGTILPGGGDWLVLGDDGFGRLDVRATFRTHDGALIYLQYHGLIEMAPATLKALGGGAHSTGYEDQYFFTTPRLETADERYAWVNRTVFVAEGRVLPGPAMEYRVYRVAR